MTIPQNPNSKSQIFFQGIEIGEVVVKASKHVVDIISVHRNRIRDGYQLIMSSLVATIAKPISDEERLQCHGLFSTCWVALFANKQPAADCCMTKKEPQCVLLSPHYHKDICRVLKSCGIIPNRLC